jgi:hypothetical protein
MGEPPTDHVQVGPAVVDRQDRPDRTAARADGIDVSKKLHGQVP